MSASFVNTGPPRIACYKTPFPVSVTMYKRDKFIVDVLVKGLLAQRFFMHDDLFMFDTMDGKKGPLARVARMDHKENTVKYTAYFVPITTMRPFCLRVYSMRGDFARTYAEVPVRSFRDDSLSKFDLARTIAVSKSKRWYREPVLRLGPPIMNESGNSFSVNVWCEKGNPGAFVNIGIMVEGVDIVYITPVVRDMDYKLVTHQSGPGDIVKSAELSKSTREYATFHVELKPGYETEALRVSLVKV